MQISRRRICCTWQSTNNHIDSRWHIREYLRTDMPKPARNSMTSYRRPDSFADDQSESWLADAEDTTCIVTRVCVDNQVVSSYSSASTHSSREIDAAVQSVRLR